MLTASPSPEGLPVEGQGALPRFFSVTQYCKSVERKIKQEIPKVWVQGTITQLNVRGRVAYLTLAEFENDDARPKAAVDVFLWAAELEGFNARFANLPTPFSLKVMIKVACRLEPGFYVPTGRFQPHVVDVDPRFTLGELAITRAKILAALRRDGLLEKNKALTLADCPLRVGLITAPGSAAYQDFTTVLLASGFSFEIIFAGARMQGDNTESSVIAALKALSAKRLDCICVVRGGGSRTDLVYFDSEAICRAIANCPVPVLTGIGHEIDRSLADEVAHADLITPTDCAKFLEERLQEALGNLAALSAGLGAHWSGGLQAASQFLGATARHLGQAFLAARDREKDYSRSVVGRLRQALRFHQEEAHLHLRRNAIGLRRGPPKAVQAASWKLRQRGERLLGTWALKKSAFSESLIQRREHLTTVFPLRLRTEKEALGLNRKQLVRVLRSGLRAAKDGLESKSRWLRTVDPAFILRLGYALVRDAKGEIIKAAAKAVPGDKLSLQWQDGEVQAEVLGEKENH